MSNQRTIDIELDASGTLPAGAYAGLARRAEEAGFAGLWKGETTNHDPFTLLAAAASTTRTMQLGTAIVHVLARSPVAAGMAAATLAEVSGGRCILGIGVGNATLAAWHGTSFAKPIDLARDYVTIARQASAGERVAHEGRALRAKDFRLTAPGQQVPMYLAALGPNMCRLAGAIADGVLVNMATTASIRQIRAWVDEGALAAGRDPRDVVIAAKVRVAVAENVAAARDALRPTVAIYTRAAGYREQFFRAGLDTDMAEVDAGWNSSGFRGAVKAISDHMLDTLPSIATNTVASAVEGLQPYFEAGANRVIVPMVPASPDVLGETERFIDSFASLR